MRLLLGLAALVLLSLVAACGDSEGAAPSPSPSPSPSASQSDPGTATARPSTVDSPPATATRTQATAATPTRTGAAATATPTATSRPATGAVVENGPGNVRNIALTFDMGGRVDPAVEIMNWLVANNVNATIFMTGAMAANPNTEAGREVLRIIGRNSNRLELGSHSYSHPDFRDLSPEQMADELRRTEDALRPFVSQDPRPLFRPPFGGQDADVVAGVAAAGYSRVIMWDIDAADWRPESEGGPTTAAIVEKVVSGAKAGSIVLMHLGGYNTLASLPEMVSRLRAAGFELVTVSDMLGLPR